MTNAMRGLHLRPITLTAANAFVKEHHRHNKPTVGHRFSIGAYVGDELVGVAIIGRPVARMLDDQFTAEVTRTCVLGSAPKGTNSFLYAKAKRIWQAMGGTRLITYVLEREGGASLRGAGWNKVQIVSRRSKPWHGPDRQRTFQTVYGEVKARWEAPL